MTGLLVAQSNLNAGSSELWPTAEGQAEEEERTPRILNLLDLGAELLRIYGYIYACIHAYNYMCMFNTTRLAAAHRHDTAA